MWIVRAVLFTLIAALAVALLVFFVSVLWRMRQAPPREALKKGLLDARDTGRAVIHYFNGWWPA